MTVQSQSFIHLRQKLDEWRQAGLLTPPEALAEERFHTEAASIRAVLESLAEALTDAGLPAEVRTGSDEKPAIGIEIEAYRVGLWLSPAANPGHLRAITKGGCGGAGVIEWLIPYSFLPTGRLERELQQAMVRLLNPQRS